ncbi:lytic murein transglycosylase B [Paracandidimonas soli]|uniref:lytic murein transglycosylase B n=1 Tax=Paracandidimonas soli TaxID=1917182 RepID=UPI000A82FDBC
MSVLRIVPSAILSIALAGCAARADRIETADTVSTPESGAPAIMPASHAAPQPPARENPPAPASSIQLQDFAETIAKERGIPLKHAQQLLSEASFNSRIAQLMTPSKTKAAKKSWAAYRKRFVEPIRIRQGLAFWQRKQETLDSVSTQYGIPASILVSIIGVETLYGQHMGNFRVLDALYTLGFHFPDSKRPERAAFFREQLADLIQLDHEGRLDARRTQGSYAGALGIPQFMPGSLMRYAADGDNDGKIDLFGNEDDAIASVASFLRKHDWQPGLPVFAPVRLPADPAPLVHGGLKPSLQWSQLQDKGASLDETTGSLSWQAHPLGVIDLPEESQGTADYRTATPNFFAITEYNRSYFYATAVTDLAEELAARMGYGSPNYSAID